MTITHQFVSAVADGADATLVRPSDWNEDHTVTGYIQETLFNAKGDLIVATAADTASVLTAGANDSILMADSAQTTGLKWVAAATPNAVGTASAEGTSDTFSRGSHIHAHEAAHIAHDTLWDTKGDIVAATAADTAGKLAVGTDGHILTADSAQATGLIWAAPTISGVTFSIGALVEGAPPSNGFRMIWRAPFNCTVTAVRSHFDAGTNCVVNARKNQASDFMSADFTNSTANAWGGGTVNQNQSISSGDDIEVELVSTSGAVTKANIQVELTRTV